MITLSQKEQLLKTVREGTDIRNACAELKISRASLYRYFADFPAYRKEIDDAAAAALKNEEMLQAKSDADRLLNVKNIVRNRKR